MDALREGAPTGTAGRASLRRVLVAAEVALAVVITVSAGQAVQGFRSLHAGSRGFSAEGVGTMLIRPPDARVEDSRGVIDFFGDVLARASAVPGVESAGLVSQLPASLRHGPTVELRIEGRPEPGPGETPLADVLVASGGYFRTAGIPLLDGRTFDARDDVGEDGGLVVVVGERLARRYWPGESPLGKTAAGAGRRRARRVGEGGRGGGRRPPELVRGRAPVPVPLGPSVREPPDVSDGPGGGRRGALAVGHRPRPQRRGSGLAHLRGKASERGGGRGGSRAFARWRRSWACSARWPSCSRPSAFTG